jgi:hypothetical protein
MAPRTYHITAAVLFFILIPLTAWADILHLKNGNELKVERAWQDSDQVWFILQGLKASIPQSKVVRIENGSGVPEKSGAPENQNPAGIKQSGPQPAKDVLPDQIKPLAAGSVSAAQSQNRSADKALVLRQDGFNDLKWGVRRSGLKGLEKRLIDSGLDEVMEYVRPADVLKLGDAALTSVIYSFWKDQLYTVTIWAQGPANYIALRDAVFNQFGQGSQIEGAGERYLWSEGLTEAMLKYENEDQYGLLWMRSTDLDRKLKLTKLSSPTSYLKWMKSRK